MPIVNELANGIYELGAGGAGELKASENFLWRRCPRKFFSRSTRTTERMHAYSLARARVLARTGGVLKGGVETEESVADGGHCIMTEKNHFFVEALG